MLACNSLAIALISVSHQLAWDTSTWTMVLLAWLVLLLPSLDFTRHGRASEYDLHDRLEVEILVD
jgi:hypothetical protein